MTTLTDRYVAATLRSVPEKSRRDIERELRASIADALDARLQRGETREAAEVAVLTELGDPSRLAAEYGGRPRYLIGPSVYHLYVRTLGLALLVTVPPAWSLILAVWVAGGASLPAAALTASAGAVFIGLTVCFMTTIGYAAVEYSEDARREVAAAFGARRSPWTPDQLPTTTSIRPVRINEVVEAIVGGTIGIALVFVQRSVSPFSDAAGHVIPILNTDLWSLWIPVIIVISLALIAVEFYTLVRGSWTAGTATILSLMILTLGTIQIYLLATGQLFNTAFFEKLGAAPWIATGSVSVILLILLTVVDTGTRIGKAWGVQVGRGPS